MKLLIDADYIVYKCCASCEYEIDYGNDVIVVASKFSEAMRAVERELDKIGNHFPFSNPEKILFFSGPNNFRKRIDPAYKGHRNRKKPCGYKRVINALHDNYRVEINSQLEADDLLGIYATQNPGNVIVSPDKDMRQIPGKVWNFDETMSVTPDEGREWHYIQTLAGDQTDGYAGVPGIGIKRAVTLFEKDGYYWDTVLEAFEAKGLTETDALRNARLAKILTINEYDESTGQPILWSPSSSDFDPNPGARSKNEENSGRSGEQGLAA